MACLDDFPRITVGDATVFHGSNLDVLPFMADNSVDSIVCDPPYELGFMGKKWDSSGIAYSVELWRECLRVLKPGGHLLAFGGSRTWHRVAVAIEDAGFDVRDSIAWLYGSGFPKSLDISKAIDKRTGENRQRQLKFVNWMKSTGITAKQINDATNTKMGSHYLTHLTQPAIATADLFDKLRPYLPEVPEEIERLVAERTGIEWTAYKNREVIGSKMSGIANAAEKDRHTIGASKAVEVNITAPATDDAKKWAGWGTALKPAFEPVVVARKPLVGTVAENVLAWGVGGLNIDASRIAHGSDVDLNQMQRQTSDHPIRFGGIGKPGDVISMYKPNGRWPANIILDEYTAGLLDEQSEDVSRFFYVSKASKRDRNEGLDRLQVKQTVGGGGGIGDYLDDVNAASGKYGSEKAPAQNFHPTVKPTDLMRYLIKLVTPAGGIVLDPFTGSGSTGKAALLDGYQFIGIELTEDYLPIIEGRLRWADQEHRNQVEASKAEAKETLF